ncbi:MAG: UpxY family transcription antiterminator [Bacteroidetes bacterium]|nr:UpxY family transcription antiterminator [Bacteroidota bacterium]MBU1798361.1 UpxY family transcription antiterminator [Bacteroidota bacterium]
MKKWFPLYTKPRHEVKALEQIKELGIEVFLPTIVVLKQWSDRKKKVTEALFKSYIFINAIEKERNYALTCDAVLKSITFDGKVATIPESEIESLKIMLKTPERIQVIDGISKGKIVLIESGPFTGVEGYINSISKDESTLSLSIELLNRTVKVVIPSSTKIKAIN